MLAKWTEILPLFLVRILANRYCEHVPYYQDGKLIRTYIAARPDVFIKVTE